TAIADVLAGFLFVGAGAELGGELALLCCASVCLYSGGTVLNDVSDARRDALERPERPLPSGTISRRAAAVLAGLLLATGLALASAAGLSPLRLAAPLVACIVAYDLLLKTTPLAPVLMGVCRALNLMLGMSVVQPLPHAPALYVAALMWLYIASVTFFARREALGGSRVRLTLGTVGAAVAVLGLVGLVAVLERPHTAYLLLVGVLLVSVLFRTCRALATRRPHEVQQAVRTMIFSLILFDASLAFASRGLLAAALVAGLLVPALALGALFRAT
ncbi:MAG: UbiA family prenyltransferase, partial [Planctomycetota bacterium]